MKKSLFTLIAVLTCATTIFATEGALKGKFTINDKGDQIVFSQGNLQYVGTWQFATNQWDTIGTEQADDYRDLFGWGTGSNPNKTPQSHDYSKYTEWGTNPITNGGNEPDLWRTLSKDEWVYIFYGRTDAAKLFALGSVNNINGIIILPDNFQLLPGATFTPSTSFGVADQGDFFKDPDGHDHYIDNTYMIAQWQQFMEPQGAVFLPAAGIRNENNVAAVSATGGYWSKTPSTTYNAYSLSFISIFVRPQNSILRDNGISVRLVQPAPEDPADIPQTTNHQSQITNYKSVKDGVLLIHHGNQTFDARGARVE